MTKEELQLLIKTHDRSKSNTIRLDKLESRVEDIYELTVSVKEIATEIKAMREDMNKIDNRLIAVESKPAKRWESVYLL